MTSDQKATTSGTVTIGGRMLPVRWVVAVAGVVLWLGFMFYNTGANAGFSSIFSAAQFLLPLLVVTAATRTVSLRLLLAMFLFGGLMMGAALIIERALALTADSTPGDLAVSIIEEAAFLAPLAVLLYKWRRDEAWKIGASDVLLLCVSCGAGLAMVETAYLIAAQGPWVPIVQAVGNEIRGRQVLTGHHLWSALAGEAIGLATLLRYKQKLAWIAGGAGISLGVIDHFYIEYRRFHAPETLATFLLAVDGNGFLPFAAYIIGLIAVIVIDAIIIYSTLPSDLGILAKQAPVWTSTGWTALLKYRRLAFANFHFEHSRGKEKKQAAHCCIAAVRKLIPND